MKIAFASCAKIQDYPEQPAWKMIEDEQPDLLLLLGDNVYARNRTPDLADLERRYKEQLREPNFASLISKVQVKAIWDDHDFGPDNSWGADPGLPQGYKDRTRDLFHRYMDSSTNLPEAYYSFTEGDIHFVMLDVRYYREDPDDAGSSPIGATQLAWLKDELNKPSKFKILCSGTGLTKLKGFHESLDEFKGFYQRDFLPLLKQVDKLIVLSGDIHRNLIRQHDGFPEFVSSAVGRGGSKVFSPKIRNNYGILEFKDRVIDVSLKGRKSRDRHSASIDIPNWTMTES